MRERLERHSDPGASGSGRRAAWGAQRLLLLLPLLTVSALALAPGKKPPEESSSLYPSRDSAPRPVGFVCSDPKFTLMWTETIAEILSRQLSDGQFIESSGESGIYPNTFPRSLTATLLLKAGYLREARRSLDFLWERQKEDGSFANFYDRRGVGGGIVEEDGGCYVVWQTHLYYLVSRDLSYLEGHWGQIRRALGYVERLIDPELGLVFSTAGYSEGNIAGGYDVYQQAVSARAFLSGEGIARALGKEDEARRYAGEAERIRQGIRAHLVSGEEGHYVFQRRKDGTFFDPPYPAALVLSYYDVVEPRDPALEKAVARALSGPRYGEYSEELFGLEPFDHAHPTGRGFWIGQNGHGWVLPYLLKAGRLAEADRWFLGLVAATDDRTYLVPEHINWAAWDQDGGDWAGRHYGVLPDPSAWVDPGNLYALTTAMNVVFTMVGVDPGDLVQVVTLRVPPTLTSLGMTNLRAREGPLDVAYERTAEGVRVGLSGAGEGSLVLVGYGERDRPEVQRDGVPYTNWVLDPARGLAIRTDLAPHSFEVRPAPSGM